MFNISERLAGRGGSKKSSKCSEQLEQNNKSTWPFNNIFKILEYQRAIEASYLDKGSKFKKLDVIKYQIELSHKPYSIYFYY